MYCGLRLEMTDPPIHQSRYPAVNGELELLFHLKELSFSFYDQFYVSAVHYALCDKTFFFLLSPLKLRHSEAAKAEKYQGSFTSHKKEGLSKLRMASCICNLETQGWHLYLLREKGSVGKLSFSIYYFFLI